MTLFVVVGTSDEDEPLDVTIFGVFSTPEKAEEVIKNLDAADSLGEMEYSMVTEVLDEPNETYYFCTNNPI